MTEIKRAGKEVLHNSLEFYNLKTELERLRRKYKLEDKDILEELYQTELIPINIFSTKTSPLESIVRYLKENLNYRLVEIAQKLNRSQKTIWQAYNSVRKSETRTRKTTTKKSILLITEKIEYIPLDIFKKDKLSILESLVLFLKQHRNKRFKDIARALNRNERTVWTTHHRAQQKIGRQKK